MHFERIGEFAYLRHSNGIWHTLHMASVVAYIVCGLIILFLTYRKERNKSLKTRILMVALTTIAEEYQMNANSGISFWKNRYLLAEIHATL